MTVILFFAVANLLGWLLWRTRRLSCYASTQILIAISDQRRPASAADRPIHTVTWRVRYSQNENICL